jgi:hypothetical protein
MAIPAPQFLLTRPPYQQQREHDRSQGAKGEPKCDSANLTLGWQSCNLGPQEVQFIQDLSKIFSRFVGLTQGQAFGAEVIGHVSQ